MEKKREKSVYIVPQRTKVQFDLSKREGEREKERYRERERDLYWMD